MKYWNEISDSAIRLADTDVFQRYPCVLGRINEQGYVDDPLQKTDVLYMGTCDIMSSIPYPDLRWSALLHDKLFPELPFITIGTSATGLPTMIRRLYSFIGNYGPPKIIYLTVARFDSYEFVNKSGKCYSVNSRVGTPEYLKRRNLITDEEFDVWVKQTKLHKDNMDNVYNNMYILEERFSFLETLCKAHNIELRWSFNLTDASIVLLHRNIAIFENISNFMKNSFVGLAHVEDMQVDRSMGVLSHCRLYEQFIKPTTNWDYNNLCDTSQINYNWLVNKFENNLIKNEFNN